MPLYIDGTQSPATQSVIALRAGSAAMGCYSRTPDPAADSRLSNSSASLGSVSVAEPLLGSALRTQWPDLCATVSETSCCGNTAPWRWSAHFSTRSSKGTRHAYDGLLQARLNIEGVPTVWEIRDLRSNVSGDDQTWTKIGKCLVCGSFIA